MLWIRDGWDRGGLGSGTSTTAAITIIVTFPAWRSRFAGLEPGAVTQGGKERGDRDRGVGQGYKQGGYGVVQRGIVLDKKRGRGR